MKKITTLAILIGAIQLAIAQAPQLLNYQSVVRNAQGQPLQNTLVNFQFQILAGSQTGTPVFTETDTATTNQFGLATVQIGKSTPLSNVTWSNGAQYLQVGIDVTGSNNFVTMGVNQLLSVPYALYAANGGGGGNGWGLSGNTGTTYGTDFIGTTDNNNLMFKVNDTISGSIQNGSTGNTSLGYAALLSNTGSYNTALGERALGANTSGVDNTAIGKGAMRNITSGFTNVAVGVNTLFTDTTGNFNTAVGVASLYSNTGTSNSAFGHEALYLNTTGGTNSASGAFALYHNTTGYSNVAMGISALYNNTTLPNQVAIGDSALYNENGTHGENTALGSKTLFSDSSGYNNTAVGYNALFSNTTASLNTAVGWGALYVNSTGGYNTAIGANALTQNYSALYNTATGTSALAQSNGNSNTANGYNALYGNRAGYNNTALGSGTDVFYSYLHNVTIIGAYAIGFNSNTVVLGDERNDTIFVGIGTGTPVAKLDISAASGFNALHISGLTPGSNGDQILTINASTGMVDSTHLLHYVGESYGGGIVFYVYDNGLHGLIAARTDQSTGIAWYNGTNATTGATLSDINGGKLNYIMILVSQGNGSYAAQLCTNYEGGGFADWYLPSLYEGALMESNIGPNSPLGNVGSLSTGQYWSSTEYNSSQAWQFAPGGSNNQGKSITGNVRAIRAF